MSLQFITGNSGNGKTKYLFNSRRRILSFIDCVFFRYLYSLFKLLFTAAPRDSLFSLPDLSDDVKHFF